ncbi:MAG: gamma-glutamyltransferase [Pseudomonas sp.]|uniref:gamma-glutamyltransferase family protein n=1 Tax=Pseudomonas abieticivorans TaxID=2931382 RepID=UPI0020C17E07|nr:gamma-glutamyltransferase [Pseudomonas sp. PIA16]MDE1165626.1 gamma-glutamyltransferase [Pseudomonas sp.]
MIATTHRGLLCTPHPDASAAGLRILDAGGTAIDAMIAASAALTAVYPHMTGIGGDALWLLHDSQVRTIVGIGQAGQRLPGSQRIGLRGPSSVATTAGAMASWATARRISEHEWGSPLALNHLLEDAEYLARTGVAISASQLFWQGHRHALIDTLPDLHALCKTDGRWLEHGDTLKQPALANTLQHLGRHGLEDFYSGELAHAFAEHFQALDCGLTLQDLKDTRAPMVAPLSIRYRQGHLFNVAPPCQGLYTLQAMNALNTIDLNALGNGSAAYYHHLVEAIKQGLLSRNAELHDPRFSDWNYAARLNTPIAIDPDHAAPWNEPGRPADTAWMAATDAQGRTACLIQSLFHDFGSGCVMGDTGVLWQNRAAGFNASPSHPNAWAPGKRPAHTLNPSCYLADNGRQWFFGTQGGDGQPQTQMVLATQLIDFDQPIDQALRQPRFLLGRSFFDGSDNLKLEADIGQAVIDGLAHKGHDVETIAPLNPFTGQAGAISIQPDGLRHALHDPRGEGCALAQVD